MSLRISLVRYEPCVHVLGIAGGVPGFGDAAIILYISLILI